MTAGIRVLDGHMHLLTTETKEEERNWLPPMLPVVAEAARRRAERYEREQAVPCAAPAEETVEAAAARWLGEFDRHGVAAAVFVALAPKPETLCRFAALHPDRLLAFTLVNPWEEDAGSVLEADIRCRGFRGLKLYPSIQRFHAHDERAYSVYAQAETLGCPVLFHFGVTLDYRSDLRYANPLDLHPVARDFPQLALIVAHAGAGFLRETLMLAYHSANVFVDTSGSFTWTRYQPRPWTRREVLARLLDVFGPERILYGSDSRHASEGYRYWILQEQREILEDLRVPEDDQRKILGGNMAQLLRIPW